MFKKIFIAFMVFVISIMVGSYVKQINHPITTSPVDITAHLSSVEDDSTSEEIVTPTPYNTESSSVSDPETNSTVQILISFAGDCTIGSDDSFSYTNSFPHRLEMVNNDFAYFFGGVLHIFEEDDLTLVNLETTLTTATKRVDKKFCFKGDPSYVNILKEGSIEMVNIANNHIYDYYTEGFNETLKTLDEAGILYSGEGIIAYYETKGIVIASIGYRAWGTGIKDPLKKDIERAKEVADIVIVSFHWGEERVYYPNSIQTTLGRFAIDQGVDVVVGHHPHVIQGIERYKGKYIVYSLGNFSFGGNRNPEDKDTFIFQNSFTFKGRTITESEGIVIPCSISSFENINDFRPTVLTGDNKERVVNRLFEYSSTLKYGIVTDDISILE